MPDLILVDGGEGHVCVAREQLEADGIDIPVFGMVKDSYHKTRAITDGEREISIASSRDIYNLIYRIQEEVHRFTVSRMSNAKRKSLKHSSRFSDFFIRYFLFADFICAGCRRRS